MSRGSFYPVVVLKLEMHLLANTFVCSPFSYLHLEKLSSIRFIRGERKKESLNFLFYVAIGSKNIKPFLYAYPQTY